MGLVGMGMGIGLLTIALKLPRKNNPDTMGIPSYHANSGYIGPKTVMESAVNARRSFVSTIYRE